MDISSIERLQLRNGIKIQVETTKPDKKKTDNYKHNSQILNTVNTSINQHSQCRL
jgi:hypothetical protein